MTAQQPTDLPQVGTVLLPGAIGVEAMIFASFLRLLCAGGLCLLSFAFYSPSGDNGLAALIAIGGIVWGVIELFILSGLLLIYGITGIAHDVSAINERDPWNRW